MSTLTKDFVPLIAGDPGTPPTPPSPPYCIDVTTYQQTYGVKIIYDPNMPPPSGISPPPPPGGYHIFVYSTGTKPVTTQQCYPATPGDPGVPPTPPTPADYNAGWSGGARSVASLVAGGEYTFSVPVESVGVITGLNDVNNGTSYQEIDHAFYLASGTWKIMEKGVQVGPSGSFNNADVFKISRVGTQVTYRKGAALLYTSLVSSTGIVFVDSSLYFGNDQIVNAALTDTTAANDGTLLGVLPGMGGTFSELGGRMTGVLSPLSAYFADSDLSEFRGVLDGMTGVFGADGGIHALLGELPGLRSQFIASDVTAVLDGTLGSMEGYFDSGLLTPDFSTLNLQLQPMGMFSVALAGVAAQLTGVMGGLRGFFSDQPDGGYMQSGAAASAVDPDGDWEGRGGDQLRMLTGFFIDEESVAAGSAVTEAMIVLPMLTVDANISTSNRASVNAILPFPLTTHVEMGTQVEVALPMLSVDATGIFENVLRTNILLPTLSASGTGMVGTILGTPDAFPAEYYPMALPRLEVRAHVSGQSGGMATLPMLVVDGKILVNLSLDGSAKLPRLRVDAHLTTPWTVDPQNPLGRTLQGHVVLPAVQSLKNAYGAVLLPFLRVSSRTLPDTLPVEERITYVMNLKNGAVTEFTHFPFRAMGRAYNRYWGVGMDGNLYRMGGDLDDTLPIDWAWESGVNDFGVWGQKGVLAVYIRGIFENGAYVKFVTDDAVREYDHVAAGDYKNQKVHRVPLGKGVRTDSMAFGMANPAGGYLELDKVTPEYRIIPRNL